ncbi:MAG: hypothetical protein WCR17_06065 [Candidatus Methanomethylophilaceae archaeon]
MGVMAGYSSSDIFECFNTGDLTATIVSSTNYANGFNVGGIVGQSASSNNSAVINVAESGGSHSTVEVNGIPVVNGTITAETDTDNKLVVTPEDGYYIGNITVNDFAVEIDDAEGTNVIDLCSNADANVDIVIEKVYDERERADGEVTVGGSEVRYDSYLTVEETEVVEGDWDIIWSDHEGESPVAYEVTFVTVGGQPSFLNAVTVSIDVGSQYNGKTVTVFHKDTTTGSVESFDVVVSDGKVRVTVDSLSPFMIMLPEVSENSSYLWIVAVAAILMLLILIIAYRRRSHNEDVS